ncbi:MAG: glycosyltransferase [Steroidobacteraceae bacterium]
MNILMVSDVYFPRVNGVSTSIQTYRRDLIALGHRCLLLAPRYPAGPATEDPDVVRVGSRRVPRDPEDRLPSRRALLAQSDWLGRQRIDVVHVQTPFVAHYAGVELARRLGVPVVESYHTYFEHYLHHYVPLLPRRLLQSIARRLTVSQCRQVDAVISPSGQMAEALRAYGVATPIEVLPTGLPPTCFVAGQGARFRLRHGIAAQRPLALFVGRVAHEKNIDFLLHMLARLRRLVPEVLLVIAGEGPALAHTRQLVEHLELGQHVLFVGYMDRHSELLDCYRAADVFVFASRTETQGLVLLEAMAQGTPVVSTAVMGTVDVLAGAGGAVVVPEDREAFACAVADLLHDPARREQLRERASEDAARWSSRRMAERLLRLYERVRQGRRVTKDSRRGHAADTDDTHTRVA